jgi:hypothetical protein
VALGIIALHALLVTITAATPAGFAGAVVVLAVAVAAIVLVRRRRPATG